jgi:hypothetical protein
MQFGTMEMSLSLVLEQMRKPEKGGSTVPFSIIVCPWNEAKQEGGIPIYYQNVRLKVSDRANSAEGSAFTMAKDLVAKNPNHWKNQTRNIILSDGKIRKIHIRDITHFNDRKVHW